MLTAGPGGIALAQGPQITFSVDWRGPSVGRVASGGGPQITEADILLSPTGVDSFGPLPAPQEVFTGGQLGLQRYTICLGHMGGDPCAIDVDALSYGNDFVLDGQTRFRVWFAVDEFAVGRGPFGLGPNLQTEGGQVGDISADLFIDLGLPHGPLPPGTPTIGHVGNVDGDGLRSTGGFVYRGIGLIEPNPPDGNPVNPGDNLDALHVGLVPMTPASGLRLVYYSLDSAFNDPRTNVPNSGGAVAHGFSGADVLVVDAGGGVSPQLYAQAQRLGLDLSGFDTDDLDALILLENGIPGYQPSNVPYDWLPAPLNGTPTDMLLFSVRVGSAIIGAPDSIFGAPIEPGDLLVPPPGGVGNPGLFFPAEALGLSTTRTDGGDFGDDMTGSSLFEDGYHDCNGNGVDDSVDIAVGTSNDENGNGIPDECDPAVGAPYCGCASGPCGNDYPSAGCANSTGVGAAISGIGSASVGVDDLYLVAQNLPANKFGIFYMGGGSAQIAFGDGHRCVVSGGQGILRYLPPINSGPAGLISLGPGIALSAGITSGQTWKFQCWYRDPMGPCGSAFNLSNGLSVSFVP